MRGLLLLLGLGVVLAGCGGAPDDDRLLGFTARCNDDTLVTNLDEDGCDGHGGVAETYIGGPPINRP